ncbi:hypothetical protein [Streptomyces sp. NPDC018967]|uniref:hypothetical protein n=1 Tax=Streptomyces sp. NPDC018967 TaxID=3365059 RepID=UPI0037B4E3E9
MADTVRQGPPNAGVHIDHGAELMAHHVGHTRPVPPDPGIPLPRSGGEILLVHNGDAVRKRTSARRTLRAHGGPR